MATDAELKQIQIDKYTRKQAEQFGIENRLLQCTEECGELIQALSKYQRILQGDKTCQTDMCHAEYMITDEIADVELLLEQIKYLLGNEMEVRERKLYKLDRTEQRLLE
jgi:NTP pyrophosphatase (non-canonical NTP hydrolase)